MDKKQGKQVRVEAENSSSYLGEDLVVDSVSLQDLVNKALPKCQMKQFEKGSSSLKKPRK